MGSLVALLWNVLAQFLSTTLLDVLGQLVGG
jgi:hypothetical protein